MEPLPLALSLEQFTSRVFAAEPDVAVFDCDGTLWSGDAGSSFMRWSMESGLLSPERSSWLKQRYTGYSEGVVSELAICGEMVQVYAGLRVPELRRAAAAFFAEHIEHNIFPEMRALIRQLQARGTALWAVSSTCDWVVEEGVRRFGIDPHHVLAAKVEIADGFATDRLLDVPTDEGKVTSLGRAEITAPDVVFGNSVHDAAMLRLARHAFPVNPSSALAAEAALRGWPVFYPASVSL